MTEARSRRGARVAMRPRAGRAGFERPRSRGSAAPVAVARCAAGGRRLRSDAGSSSRRAAARQDGAYGGPDRPARIRFGGRAGVASAPRPARTSREGRRAAAGRPDHLGDDRSRAAGAAASVSAAGVRHGRPGHAGSLAGVTGHGRQPAGAYWRGGVRTPPADRRRWAAGVVARPGRRRRGDRAADGCGGGAGARRGAAACRRRRLRSAADPGAAVGSHPRVAVRSIHVAGAPTYAAARARTARRGTPRSTAGGAGSRAARPAVRAASPGPAAARRAGARSTSVQTSPSAQVVAPCSA
jgi:hypothetical protein